MVVHLAIIGKLSNATFHLVHVGGTAVLSNTTGALVFSCKASVCNNKNFALELTYPSIDAYVPAPTDVSITAFVNDTGNSGYNSSLSLPLLSPNATTAVVFVSRTGDGGYASGNTGANAIVKSSVSVTLSNKHVHCVEDAESCPLPVVTLSTTSTTTSTTLTPTPTSTSADLHPSDYSVYVSALHGTLNIASQYKESEYCTITVLNTTTVQVNSSNIHLLEATLNRFVLFRPTADFNGVWPEFGVTERIIADPGISL